MKTDPFEDAIRRKLESIEPPFREKNWTQMQAFMRQHGFPPAWYGVSQWLLPVAASVVLVALVATNVWQYRTKQQLVQTVQTLKETVAGLGKQQIPAQSGQSHPAEPHPAGPHPAGPHPAGPHPAGPHPAGPHPAEPHPAGVPAPDTVSVTHYVEVPKATRPAFSPGQPTAPTTEPTTGVAQATEVRKPVETIENQKNTPKNQVVKSVGTGRDGVSSTEPAARDVAAQPLRERPFSPATTETAAAPTAAKKHKPALGGGKPRPANGGTPDRREYEVGVEKAVGRSSQTATPAEFAAPANGSSLRSMVLQPLSSLAIARDSAYFPDWMARRARKIRSLVPQTAVAATLPAATESAISGTPKLARVRVGASGELAVGQWSAGFYGEVRLAGNWLLGLGLNRLSVSGGQFLTDEQFNAKTKRDFRREYAFGIDPRQEILNINRRSFTWQVPVSLGYRLGLAGGVALIPSAGGTFSLTAREQTTFTYRRGPREFLRAECRKDRPTEWYHNYTFALAVEKAWNRLALQAGPFVTGPFRAIPEQINTPSVGVRTRVLFQF